MLEPSPSIRRSSLRLLRTAVPIVGIPTYHVVGDRFAVRPLTGHFPALPEPSRYRGFHHGTIVERTKPGFCPHNLIPITRTIVESRRPLFVSCENAYEPISPLSALIHVASGFDPWPGESSACRWVALVTLSCRAYVRPEKWSFAAAEPTSNQPGGTMRTRVFVIAVIPFSILGLGPAPPEQAPEVAGTGASAAHHPADALRRAGRLLARRQEGPLPREDLRRRLRDRPRDQDAPAADRPLPAPRLHPRPLPGQRRHPALRPRAVRPEEPRAEPRPVLPLRPRQGPDEAAGRRWGRSARRARPSPASGCTSPGRTSPRSIPTRCRAASSRIYEADIVYEGGTPKLANQRLVLDSRDLPFRCTLETPELPPARRARADLQRLRLPGHRRLRRRPRDEEGRRTTPTPPTSTTSRRASSPTATGPSSSATARA